MDGCPVFGEVLKGARLARGLSQEALAERAGLSREAISLLERGGRLRPRRDTVALLARSLELSLAELERLEASLVERQRSVGRVGTARQESAGLPVRLTSFVGREREIAEVRELLLASRLVTFTGTGGIGKTRLALEVAEMSRAQFPDGVCLVELATLTEPDLVPHVVASSLGVREVPGQPILRTLARVVGESRRLFILDNCEHLLESCARMAEALLQACPHLQLLVTSRAPLRIGAEVVWRVPPLAQPPLSLLGVEDALDAEAIRLFVERAGAVHSGFALTPASARSVSEICRRLDGIPLAIELAAARVAALTPEQIARHLNDRFRLLTTGSRTALPRHRTLRAIFDWSHDLLSENERVLLRRLAVFAGGWTLEAAETVCGDRVAPTQDGDRPRPETLSRSLSSGEVLELLLELVDKSLVLVEDHGSAGEPDSLGLPGPDAWQRDASPRAAGGSTGGAGPLSGDGIPDPLGCGGSSPDRRSRGASAAGVSRRVGGSLGGSRSHGSGCVNSWSGGGGRQDAPGPKDRATPRRIGRVGHGGWRPGHPGT
jgi:predicted ATPase/DNA-binding XRE family transcriptional regulator